MTLREHQATLGSMLLPGLQSTILYIKSSLSRLRSFVNPPGIALGLQQVLQWGLMSRLNLQDSLRSQLACPLSAA